MPAVKFTYFDVRGIGEPARALLTYAKVPFDDVRIDHAQWPELKSKTKTGKLPFLEYDGHTLIESYAIFRFLARKFGLAGKDEFEQAQVDALADVEKDFYAALAPWFYAKLGFRQGNVDELRESVYVKETPRFLDIFTNALKESGSGFLVKSGFTWADLAVSEHLFTLKKVEPEVLKNHPEIDAFLDRIQKVPQLADYYKNRKWD